jgi:hypothetical protein
MRKIMILFILFVFILTSTPVSAANGDGFVVVADVVIARPVGLVSLVIGTAFLIVATPFAVTSGSLGTTADTLVGEPFRFTFTRPLGDFRGMSDRDQSQQGKKNQQERTNESAGTNASVEEKNEQ